MTVTVRDATSQAYVTCIIACRAPGEILDKAECRDQCRVPLSLEGGGATPSPMGRGSSDRPFLAGAAQLVKRKASILRSANVESRQQSGPCGLVPRASLPNMPARTCAVVCRIARDSPPYCLSFVLLGQLDCEGLQTWCEAGGVIRSCPASTCQSRERKRRSARCRLGTTGRW